MDYSKIVVSSIVIFLLDFVYLSSHSQYFKNMFTKIQGKSIMRYSAALLCYIAMITLLNLFILQNYSAPTSNVLISAFALGFLSYIIYDLTNYATIEKWPLYLVIVDSIWGGFLFSLTSYITLKYSKRIHI